MATARNQSVYRIQHRSADSGGQQHLAATEARLRLEPTAYRILDGVRAWRVGNRTVAYEASTRCAAGRLLKKTFIVGRRRPVAVMTDAIAERRRQLNEALIERKQGRGTATQIHSLNSSIQQTKESV